jgi:hypothetical protein
MSSQENEFTIDDHYKNNLPNSVKSYIISDGNSNPLESIKCP